MKDQEDRFKLDKLLNLDNSALEIEKLSLMMADVKKEIKEETKRIINILGEKDGTNMLFNVAKNVKEKMLPNAFPAFPERSEFEVFASLYPCNEVTGDFYDFFLIDDNHLGVVIGDVSHKGLEALSFMVACKTIISKLSMLGIKEPGEILELVNDIVFKNKSNEMFLKVWLGILDITSGVLKASNASQECPFVYGTKEEYELLEDKHGPAIGTVANYKYETYEVVLDPGDSIFVYTDGITNSINKNNELFGQERLLKTLNINPQYSVVEMLNFVKEKIDGFVEDVPQLDDMAMLGLTYFGKEENELEIDGDIDNIPAVTAFVEKKLEALNCPLKVQNQIAIAIDELFSNIAKYAYKNRKGKVTIKVEELKEPHSVLITFIDDGPEYNPLAKDDPDVTLSAEEREIGGLGIFLVKKTMNEMIYNRIDNKNVLKIRKEF